MMLVQNSEPVESQQKNLEVCDEQGTVIDSVSLEELKETQFKTLFSQTQMGKVSQTQMGKVLKICRPWDLLQVGTEQSITRI